MVLEVVQEPAPLQEVEDRMILTWTRPDRDCGSITAAGLKGTYTVRWVGMQGYSLTGVGHDTLPMLALPPYGRMFGHLDHAKDHAAALERVKACEAQAGGE